ncbi:MAG: isopenicillin N synthase family oxygenase [Candidatus Caenarcaniphilales bacterium]|nr:isopenicillin N synthase family oxygenase [Candidatus Caenarcaniphilales bacterium]
MITKGPLSTASVPEKNLGVSPIADKIAKQILDQSPVYTDPDAGRKVQEAMLKYGIATAIVPGITEKNDKLLALTQRYAPQEERLERLAKEPKYTKNSKSLYLIPKGGSDEYRSMMLWNQSFGRGELANQVSSDDFEHEDKKVITDVFDTLRKAGTKILSFLNEMPKIKGNLDKTVEAMSSSDQVRLGTNYNTPTMDGSDLTGVHRDYGTATFLPGADKKGAYQFYYNDTVNPENSGYVPLSLREDHIIIQPGLQMEVITGGEIQAAEHRVINNLKPGEARASTAFFMQPNANVDLRDLKADGVGVTKLESDFVENTQDGVVMDSLNFSQYQQVERMMRPKALSNDDKKFFTPEKLGERVKAYMQNGLNAKIATDLLAEFADS